MRKPVEKQGLYDPQYEHDACGVGFICNIKGNKSHKIIFDALKVLCHLDHRGATGAETNTGDGAGILIQVCHDFFGAICEDEGISLPGAGQYGVGMLYMPPDKDDREKCRAIIDGAIEEEGHKVFGWRKVPTDNSMLGDGAKSLEPEMWQVFIGRGEHVRDDDHFELELYLIRRHSSNLIRDAKDIGQNWLYYPSSMSARTINYKGMLTPAQVPQYYLDLKDERMTTAIALVHSRFSTNTFPNWQRSHPYRYVAHNGEINTLRGNVNWMRARQQHLAHELLGDRVKKIIPVIQEDGSDSSMFDNALEFLSVTGRSMAHASMMMVPEPWTGHESMPEDKKAFYEYHSCLMEPWDGPASIAFTNGLQMGAILDRNGLRPSRYYITEDDLCIMASEAGVLADYPPEQVVKKGRLQPGQMFLIDSVEGRIIDDEELKSNMARELPYKEWLDENLVPLESVPEGRPSKGGAAALPLLNRQQAFGYTYEDLRAFMTPMANTGVEPVAAMGSDTPLAVLSDKSQLLYNYFKQLFAQVTNPPIDSIREEIITSTVTTLGAEGNLLDPRPESCRQVKLSTPLITDEELAQLRDIDRPGLKAKTLPIIFPAAEGAKGLEQAFDELCAAADAAVDEGNTLLILSDRDISAENAPIPALLAVAGLHHHLIRNGRRTQCGIILESGEPRDVHAFAVLIGYGCGAINPYLAFESLGKLIEENLLQGVTHGEAIKNFVKAGTKGVVKTMAKMGISTIQSYRGAQIFEAVGLNKSVIDKYFTWTASRIEGIGVDVIAEETLRRHRHAFFPRRDEEEELEAGGKHQWRHDGERHLLSPTVIHRLQRATRVNDRALYNQYAGEVNEQSRNMCTIRGLMEFKYPEGGGIPIEEVESAAEIVKRFKTGAMSYGSISKEAHEALAIAMNRIGGKSNTGEGGEDPERYIPLPNGDSKNSAIKQVASGRFGVTSHYLVNARELQIKMAQGAKPGEGGQLPGSKVYPPIAKVRHSTPGVGLISPPPHHDIYSIEDLAELIHDLKNGNRFARVSVKLVSEVGVGTVAAGVSKAKADVVLISGHDGGTGASPLSSIHHAGLPWELGLAETHQTLMLNNLRDRIAVETDGQLKTGRDVAIAAILGAEEFGFATAPLVVLGCIMMRACHLNTCPVGIATQDPRLRKKYMGSPDHVVNFFHFVAEELREIMAKLGVRTLPEMIGRTELLEMRKGIDHYKAKGIDLSKLLYKPDVPATTGHYNTVKQDHGLDKSLDITKLLDICEPAIERGEKVEATLPITNIDRVVGTITGSEVSKKHGMQGLPEDTIKLTFQGSAGQSFGAFVPRGMTMKIVGDTNDYFGKGLSGGKVIVTTPEKTQFVPEENIICGNVAFYGATSGEGYIRGLAGERFCVRNSGVRAVVEGVGDHGCEYMTGGAVVVLGKTGRNFAAGMSGGAAYVLDVDGKFKDRVNMAMVALSEITDPEEINEVRLMIEHHVAHTDSAYAQGILEKWDAFLPKFVKVMPHDYARMLACIEKAKASGLTGDEAAEAAFELNAKDKSRIGGN